jgi:hypothetical protein
MRVTGFSLADKGVDPAVWGKLAERTVKYLESCRVADGGYYFARVPPGSPHDTFYAVAALKLLGAGPAQPEKAAEFFYQLLNREALESPAAIYFAVATLTLLGKLDEKWLVLGEKLRRVQEPEGGFWVPRRLWVEAASRLENTCYAVGALTRLGVPFDKEACARFVAQESTTAMTSGGLASLATAYFGVEILSMLKQPLPESVMLLPYLDNVVKEAGFLEHWYYLAMILVRLSHPFFYSEKAVDFVLACERTKGGFARATSRCAIPTVVSTFQASAILDASRILPVARGKGV